MENDKKPDQPDIELVKVSTYLKFKLCKICNKQMVYSHYQSNTINENNVYVHSCPGCNLVECFEVKYPVLVYAHEKES